MKIEKPFCPECGQEACGTSDSVYARANITRLLDGSFEYTGETTVWWDTQETVTDEATELPLLTCPDGHEWPSGIT